MLADKIKPYIPQLVSRDLTNRALAAELGVSESYLCRVLKKLKVKREPAPDPAARAAQAALNEARRAHRLDVAKTLSVKDAARAANCSTRTIYRLRKKNDA